mgnify:FL=1
MRVKLFLFFLLSLSLNIVSADYYKCKPEKAYKVSDSGVIEEYWLIGFPFTVDRVSGEYRSDSLNANFRVLTKGNKDSSFRATLERSIYSWPYILVVKEYSDSIKKPYIMMDARSARVRSGLCERF